MTSADTMVERLQSWIDALDGSEERAMLEDAKARIERLEAEKRMLAANPTDAMFEAAAKATGCPSGGHIGERNREFFTQIYVAMRDEALSAVGEIRETR